MAGKDEKKTKKVKSNLATRKNQNHRSYSSHARVCVDLFERSKEGRESKASALMNVASAINNVPMI